MCHHHTPAPQLQWKATVTTRWATPPLSDQHHTLHLLPVTKTPRCFTAFENSQTVTETRRVKNYLMKNEAAAEVPAETPAGATMLWEAAEPPAPAGSELFCPELIWTPGPSRPLSGAVSAWKKQTHMYRLIHLLNGHHGEKSHAALAKSLCRGEGKQWIRSDTAGQAYHSGSYNREGKNHGHSRWAEKQRHFRMGSTQLNSLTGNKWKMISRTLLFHSVIWELAELFIWFSYNCQELFLSGTSSTRLICLRGRNPTVTFVKLLRE